MSERSDRVDDVGQTGSGCVARPSEATWREPELFRRRCRDGLGVMVGDDDDINFESTEGCKAVAQLQQQVTPMRK